MAGAGYKLFNTGDVLTAAQVNTYLQEQTVMVFADATARTTALSGVLAEGMVTYLKSTKVVEIYNGTAWASLDDPNAIQNTIVDAKGDLISATANDTPARLAVGNNGETLVADSSATTGLRWQGDWNTGKNKIINGDFNIWQRGTSFTIATGNGAFTADRFEAINESGANVTASRQTFTPGAAPVAGYEGQYFCRLASTSATGDTYIVQRIEDVRTFAGQTVTISFWARCSSGTVSSNGYYLQGFGTGGSSTVFANLGAITITTSWQRFTQTIAIPSVSGKTIGANSSLAFQVLRYAASNTVDLWGVQVEAGSVATPFTTATGTLAGELAASQRYYYRTATGSGRYGVGFTKTTTTAEIITAFPVTMRTAPSALEQTGTAGDFTIIHQNTSTALSIVPAFNNANVNMASTNLTVASGLTAGNGCALSAATGNSYLGWSAEL